MESRVAVRGFDVRWIVGALLALAFLGSYPASASAGTGEEVAALPTLDPLNRNEEVFSGSGNWAPLSWASTASGHPSGRDTTSGWSPYDPFPQVNGAFWKPTVLSEKNGNAAAVTMPVSPGGVGQSLALWLDTLGAVKSGYQLRWSLNPDLSTYAVTLSKYSSGAQTVLASNNAVTIPKGSTVAISDTGGTVAAWWGAGPSLAPILSASDATYSGGFAGIEGAGSVGRVVNFKAGALTGLPPQLDSFERQELPLASGKWTKSPWAPAPGGVWCCARRGYGSSAGLAGAFWNSATFTDGEGMSTIAAATVGAGPAPAGEYSALLLNMPFPGSMRSGYEARIVGTGSTTAYKVELAKWMVNSRAVLATASNVPLPAGTTVVFSRGPGGVLNISTGTWKSTPIVTATDTSWPFGYVGVEVNGTTGTIYDFRAGRVDTVPPNTTISSGPVGTVQPASVKFSFSSSEGESKFECSLDGAAFAPCASPQSYPSIARGAHLFKVRAVDAVGNVDATPAEGSFQVVIPPTVATSAASGVSASGAALKATVNPNGLATTYQFEYGTTTSYGSVVPATAKSAGVGSQAVEASEPLTGLSPGTTYNYRISATSADGTSKGENRTFTTQAAPTAKTEAANVSSTQATLKATVNPRGAETTAQFEYGTTETYGIKVPAAAKSLGAGYADVAMAEIVASGLTPGIAYHYRVVASNALGTAAGEDRQFVLPAAPTAKTEAATIVHSASAELNATVDPNGSPTSYWFEYGTSTAYGLKAPIAGTEAGSSGDPVDADEILDQLQPQTTYHYRIVAANSLGTGTGSDMTFTTAPAGSSEDEFSGEIVNEQISGAEEQGSGGSTSGAATRDWNAEIGDGEALPRNFFNVHWSHLADNEKEMLHVHKIGAAYMRQQFSPQQEPFIEKAVQFGAQNGVRILPYLYGPQHEYPTGEARKEYVTWVEAMVKKYGPGGSFWENKVKKQPIRVWEIWNEPNRGINNPGGDLVNPGDFSDFLVKVSNAIDKGSKGNAVAMLGGLLSIQTKNDIPNEFDPNKTEHSMKPSAFLHALSSDARKSYVAVGLHPYAFKTRDGAIPIGRGTAEGVADNVLRNVKGLRAAMNEIPSEKDKTIWVTELGWPLEYGDAAHPSPMCTLDPEGKICTNKCTTTACEIVHAEIVKYTFQELRAEAFNQGISHVFYYFFRDNDGVTHWDYHTGLRKGNGDWREAVYAFEAAAGVDEWPKKPDTATGSAAPLSTTARVGSAVNPLASETEYRVAWGENSVGENSTGWKSIGYGETPVEDVSEVTGLKPKTTYRYKVVAKNENGEVGEGLERTLKTEPLTDLTGTVGPTLNGEPGWAGVAGWLKHDQVGMNGVKVNVNFRKYNPSTGLYEPTKALQADVVNGQYRVENVRLGRGSWKWRVAFNGPEQGYPSSWSSDTDEPNEHPAFDIKSGYQLVASHSSKCLDVNQGSTANGASLIQYDCGPAKTSFNQVFTLLPTAPGEYQIRVRKSGRCVDVTAGSQTPGQQLSQYDCLGGGQLNQVWRGEPMKYLPDGNVLTRFVAKHSNQCMEVQASSQANGGIVDQYPCNGTQANQLWTFKSVESDPVPLYGGVFTDALWHGHPGYVTFHGSVTSNGYNMDEYWANVNFQKEVAPGNWQTIPEATRSFDLPPNGQFSYPNYWGLGSGNWRVRAVLQGENPFENEGATPYTPFTVRDGYRVKFRHSDRCLSTSENGTANGTTLIQWDCNGGSNPYEGQTFSFRPVGTPGSDYFQLLPDTTAGSPDPYVGKCVDVAGNTTVMGAALVIYQCLGPAQWNQIWHIVPIVGQSPWFGAVAVHSNQCMDVQGQSVANGARMQQWECYWGGNQQWKFIPVG